MRGKWVLESDFRGGNVCVSREVMKFGAVTRAWSAVWVFHCKRGSNLVKSWKSFDAKNNRLKENCDVTNGEGRLFFFSFLGKWKHFGGKMKVKDYQKAKRANLGILTLLWRLNSSIRRVFMCGNSVNARTDQKTARISLSLYWILWPFQVEQCWIGYARRRALFRLRIEFSYLFLKTLVGKKEDFRIS